MKNYTRIHNSIFEYQLSGQSFKLYMLLESYCFGDKTQCFPSQSTLAAKLKKSVRTIQRALKELVRANLIKVKRRGSISNLYELTLKKAFLKEESTIHVSRNIYINNKSFKNYKYQMNDKIDYFNNYEQRTYDFDKLERKLLGWE